MGELGHYDEVAADSSSHGGGPLRRAGRSVGRALHWPFGKVGRGIRRATHAHGAGESGLGKLIELHAVNSAGDMMVTIALASTVFFSVPTDQARGRVALYLAVTMAPFALLAPVIGPILDRLPHGRRAAMAGAMLARALLALTMAGAVAGGGLELYPAALGVLVASKAYGVVRSAVVPRLLPPRIALVKANSRVTLGGLLATGVAAPVGAGLHQIGPGWPLYGAFVLFGTGAFLSFTLPHKVDSSKGEAKAHFAARKAFDEVAVPGLPRNPAAPGATGVTGAGATRASRALLWFSRNGREERRAGTRGGTRPGIRVGTKAGRGRWDPSRDRGWEKSKGKAAGTASSSDSAERNGGSGRTGRAGGGQQAGRPKRPGLTTVGPSVLHALQANATLRMLSGFLTFFLAFVLREHPLNGLSAAASLGIVVVSAGTGNALGTALGAWLRARGPETIIVTVLALALGATITAAALYSEIAVAGMAATAGIAQALGKLSLDALIQRDVPEPVRTSAFARSETLMQMSWVVGGAIAMTLPLNGVLGMSVAATLVALGTVVTVRRLLSAARHGAPPRARVA
ncbi:hypothetical protein [Streptomyces sp. H27-D2]|uniref:hypothetical protein n=1 Tax=Streptomyces sp. H27-D2 TaxID=3046304 RepID=UPI002DB8AD07|nr:hypothetical protein [Streptomyces sp. H27-D2]MEC4020863.1 hypothetical protein [Streptomyces sp. H27-D2]